MANRTDALLLTSKLLLHSHRVATRHAASHALVSAGIINAQPGSTNTIPGHVQFTIDVRSPSGAAVEQIEAELKRGFARIASGQEPIANSVLHVGGTLGWPERFRVAWRTDSATAAAVFDARGIACVRDAAAARGLAARDLSSGAGHDSVHASRRCPTTMVFVPCRAGVSHNPEEYATPEDCAAGTQVLMDSVLRYDQLRKEGVV
jgi:acetylornithine deacetylase/succinyl-diaminopimelate desuccinylase-like protein